MARATIHKEVWPAGVIPNVVDYAAARTRFSWDAARAALDGLFGLSEGEVSTLEVSEP